MKKQIILLGLVFLVAKISAQQLLKDINLGVENGVQSTKNIVFKDKLYFHGSDKPNNPGTIWTTGGTSSSTQAIPNLSLVNNFDQMTNTGNKLFFQGYGFVKVLYVTDGTPAGTLNLIGLETIGLTQMLKLDENRVLLFIKSNLTLTHPDQLWVSNGSLAGTFKIRDIITSSSDTYIVSNFQGKALIYDNSPSSVFDPLITDGTILGTKTLLDDLLSKNINKFNSISACYGLDNVMIVAGLNNNGGSVAAIYDHQLNTLKDLNTPEFTVFSKVKLYSLGTKILIQSGSHLYSFENATKVLQRLSTVMIAATDYKILNGRFYAYFKETSGINYLGMTDGSLAGTVKITGWESFVLSEYNIQVAGDSVFYLTESNSQVKEIYSFHKDSTVASLFSDFGGRFRPTLMNVVNNIFVYSRNTAEYGVELHRYPDAEPSSTKDNDSKVASWSIYPQPAKDFISLDLKNLDVNDLFVSILDQNGKIIKQQKTHSSSPIISISELPAGVYMLQIRSGMLTLSKHFLKE